MVSLEIVGPDGKVIARFNSNDPVPTLDPRYPDPLFWARPPRVFSAAPGHHRFLWDMQYPQVPGMSTGPDEDQAVPHDTPSVSTAPWVMPGNYTVRLIAQGETYTQPLDVVMDPRVKTPIPSWSSSSIWQRRFTTTCFALPKRCTKSPFCASSSRRAPARRQSRLPLLRSSPA